MEAAPVLPWGPLAMREREGRKGGGGELCSGCTTRCTLLLILCCDSMVARILMVREILVCLPCLA